MDEHEWGSMEDGVGLPDQDEHPVIQLMDRTIENLDYVYHHRNMEGLFEVTQLINSFLAVIAHPWDQLLDRDKLEALSVSSQTFRDCRFPDALITEAPGTQSPRSAGDTLRLLRNGIAHGNIELLSRSKLRALRQTGPLPRVGEFEIAGIRIANKSRSNQETWSIVLDIYEMRQALSAMRLLCQERSLWKDSVRREHQERDTSSRPRRPLESGGAVSDRRFSPRR